MTMLLSRFLRRSIGSAVVTALLSSAAPTYACTSFGLTAANGNLVYGRTMEWGTFDLKSRLVVVPRQTRFTGTTPDGKPGMQWSSRYGAVGLDMIEKDYLADGMNEKGLVVGVLYHPGFAEFATYDPSKSGSSMSATDLAAYILTQFATVSEVKAALPALRIIGVPEPVLHNAAPPMHLTVMDPSGGAIVIEFTKGEVKVYDNPLKVMTNAPNFDWHLTNLRNYIGLSAFGKPAREIGGLKFAPIGAGSGFIGLPGDFTPPSRFVRAVAFTQTARKTADGAEAVYETLRILDNFSLPLAAAGSPDIDPLQQVDMRSSTIWTTVGDTANRIYYYHTQNNRMLRKVDLKRIDFSPKAAGARRFPLDKSPAQTVDDVTPM